MDKKCVVVSIINRTVYDPENVDCDYDEEDDVIDNEKVDDKIIKGNDNWKTQTRDNKGRFAKKV
jgi:hypothetical protein